MSTKPRAYHVRARQPKGARPGTLRYWQVRIELTILAMEEGKITSAECERRCRVYEQAMRTQTHLKTLATMGFEDVADGVSDEIEGEEILVAREKTVTVKRGNTPTGPVDETVVVVHSTEHGDVE